ncbi:hypothetical protein BN77_p10922 [Rhizobium mesoamericanum STM3625]|uniref:Uncharacterized protein n=1 Tax=Rhizobium mesoamericanum STM3625 TaxID=1211777 RepID=K0PNX3_9HYPH|nr:hypothetical protein BN77_p10922 [Rhizobium mesoamericanum STM3625]
MVLSGEVARNVIDPARWYRASQQQGSLPFQVASSGHIDDYFRPEQASGLLAKIGRSNLRKLNEYGEREWAG